MRICHVWHNFLPFEFGGAERYILSLSNFLANNDENINFLLLTDKSSVSFLKSPSIPQSEKFDSLEIHRLNAPLTSFIKKASYKVFQRNFKFFSESLTTQLCRTAAKIPGMNKVDVFHVHGFWLPLYPTIGCRLSQHFSRPFIVTLHGDSVVPNDPFAMPLRRAATIEVLKEARIITTFSEETLKVLRQVGLEKNSRLIPNFIDTKAFKRPTVNDSGSATKIAMISRLSQPKDPMTPIRAFAKVVKEIPEATFEIIGYGPLYEEAHCLVQSLHLEGSVTFAGMQSNVRKYLWNNDIFIATRGSYITTLEAWAAGLPVVAPKFGIMKELISDGIDGLLAEPGDAELLASQLISLIKDKRLRTELISKGHETVERHDIRNVAPKISNIYKSLISSKI